MYKKGVGGGGGGRGSTHYEGEGCCAGCDAEFVIICVNDVAFACGVLV